MPKLDVKSFKLTLLRKYLKQEMTNREYLEDQDAEEPDDFVIALTAQVSVCVQIVSTEYRFHIVI